MLIYSHKYTTKYGGNFQVNPVVRDTIPKLLGSKSNHCK